MEALSTNIIYARKPLPLRGKQGIAPVSLFLAGPTPRDETTPSWRPQALEILSSLNFTDTVMVPEDEQWGLSRNVNYEKQTLWEIAALGRAAAIVFWVPRELASMPAFTTNTEFGFCAALAPERTVFGAPPGAEKVKYQKQLAQEINFLLEAFNRPQTEEPIPVFSTLEETLSAALQKL